MGDATAPLALPAVPEPAAVSRQAADALRRGTQRPEEMCQRPVMVVDDDARQAESTAALLRHHGFDTTVETDSERALESLQQLGHELLVLDLNMPGLSGVELLESLRERMIDVAVIVYSGEDSVERIAPVIGHAVYEFVPKGSDPDRLVRSVRHAVESSVLARKNAAMSVRAHALSDLHRYVVQSSTDLVYVLDADGNFALTNNQLSELFGANTRDLSGHPWTALLGSAATDSAALRHRFAERRTGSRATHQFEFNYLDVEDQARVLELTATGLYLGDEPNPTEYSGTCGVLRDVTEQRRIARELELSRRRLIASVHKYEGLFQNSPDAVYISEWRDGKILESNHNFRRISRALEAVDPETDAHLWRGADERAAFLAGLEASPDRYSVDVEHEWSGEPRYFHITGCVVSPDSGRRILATVRDTTNERRAQAERLQYETQVQQAGKMEAIGKLAGGIAHDFNNILASMLGYSDLLRHSWSRLAPEKMEEYIGEIVQAGERARDLIAQMLSFTRFMRGKPEVLDVAETIGGIRRMLRAAIPESIAIAEHFHDDMPPVFIDPVQLHQIIINLLINARDAIDGVGQIDIEVRAVEYDERQCVSCEACVRGRWVELSVKDDGHGIEPELQGKIFDSFFTTRDVGEGTGFGLWLIHTLVHQYGGHIVVDSEPGKGARFGVLLPDAQSAQRDAPTLEPPPVPAQRVGEIVVVDNDLSVVNYIGEVIRGAGFDVRTFNDSAAARQYLLENIDGIGVLVTDQSMPQIDGVQLASEARELRADLPIVMITGYTQSETVARLDQLGLQAYLEKPFRIEDLLQTLAQLVGGMPAAAGDSSRGATAG
ncbi:MAG: response regulator [Pseudomonadota bacterium]